MEARLALALLHPAKGGGGSNPGPLPTLPSSPPSSSGHSSSRFRSFPARSFPPTQHSPPPLAIPLDCPLPLSTPLPSRQITPTPCTSPSLGGEGGARAEAGALLRADVAAWGVGRKAVVGNWWGRVGAGQGRSERGSTRIRKAPQGVGFDGVGRRGLFARRGGRPGSLGDGRGSGTPPYMRTRPRASARFGSGGGGPPRPRGKGHRTPGGRLLRPPRERERHAAAGYTRGWGGVSGDPGRSWRGGRLRMRRRRGSSPRRTGSPAPTCLLPARARRVRPGSGWGLRRPCVGREARLRGVRPHPQHINLCGGEGGGLCASCGPA